MRSSMDMRCRRSNSARREALAEALALGFCWEDTALPFMGELYEGGIDASMKAETFNV
jgi:hypothetical protein